MKSCVKSKPLYVLSTMLVLLTLFLMSSVISEQQTLGTFKQNTCVSLKQLCSPGCTYVTLTSINIPLNSTVFQINKNMTQLYPTDYNYTFCNTSILGEYVVNGFGNPDGVQTSFNYNFIVTPAGYEVSLSNTIIMFFIVGILVIVTIFMYWFGLTNKNKPLKMFFLSLSVLMTVFIIGYILSIANTSIGQFSQLTGVINSIYILGTILLAAASIAVIVYVIKFGFEQFYKSKGYEFGEIDVG